MKLKTLREHYQSTDGKNWIPKIGYKTQEEIDKMFEENGFHSRQWFVYRCGICSDLHIASLKKGKKNE